MAEYPQSQILKLHHANVEIVCPECGNHNECEYYECDEDTVICKECGIALKCWFEIKVKVIRK